MVCSGAIVSGANLHHTLVSPGVQILDRAEVERAVLLDGVKIGEHDGAGPVTLSIRELYADLVRKDVGLV